MLLSRILMYLSTMSRAMLFAYINLLASTDANKVISNGVYKRIYCSVASKCASLKIYEQFKPYELKSSRSCI
jgi:hypothetical protein